MRITWTTINCFIVWIISLLSTCTRLKVGGLLWHPGTKRIVAVGYNGSPYGQPHCLDKGCELEDGHCVACLHCETNLAIHAGPNSQGCWMFLNYSPCRRCVNTIIQMRVVGLCYTTAYGSDYAENTQKLRDANIRVEWCDHKRIFSDLLTTVLKWGTM